MKYRNDKNGNPISILGYGCMRFSRNGANIDFEKAEQEVMTAINAGINYLDTAYIYPGSEVVVGKILAKNNCRNKVSIATKLPQYLIKSEKALEKCFQEQLERLQTDYIDYYLMHMLTDVASWEKLVDLGIKEWIQKKKESGQIKNIGFSFHGNTEMFLKILEAYEWDFCQIQYNYLDEHTQAGRKGLETAYEKHIPVIIMEPLRGGKLVNKLPSSAKTMIAEHENNWSAAEWAFRWLWNQPEVTCVLSGMNSQEMVKENIRIASEVEVNTWTQEEFDFIDKIKEKIKETVKVGCTGCGYCMPCPKGIDIPSTFSCYNTMFTESPFEGLREYFMTVGMRKTVSNPYACVECGLCEKHCPQHLNIREELKNARKAVHPWYVKFAIKCVQIFKIWK